jgi:nicotinamide riboside transporter PnuC
MQDHKLLRDGGSMLGKIPNRFKVAILFLSLAPVAGGFGLWLIFPVLILTGNACVLCSPSIGFDLSSAPIGLAQASIGTVFFLSGVLLLVSSLGLFASRNDVEATRWVRWLRRLKPKIRDQTILPSLDLAKYRRYALVILLVIFVQAILLIPGIGEDRKYSLSGFSTLFLGPLWYSYAVAIGVSGFALIYCRRLGGYLLAIIFAIIGIGTTIPDVLGFLPPSAPTLRTTILALSGFPFDILLAYICWRALAISPGNGSSPEATAPSLTTLALTFFYGK